MFTDLLNLPQKLRGHTLGSAEQRTIQKDQVLSIAGMTWADYEQLTSCTFTDYKISYSNEIITIVFKSRNHERIAEVINGPLETYCRKYNFAYFPMGSTTLKNPPKSGKEPDHSFDE